MNTGTPLYCDAFDSMQLYELSTYIQVNYIVQGLEEL